MMAMHHARRVPRSRRPASGARPYLTLLACLAAAVLPASRASATPPANAAACDAPDHRDFDFWLGSWTVRDTAGSVVGRNEIRSISEGCALLESWTNAEGETGTSLNWYDPDDGKWRQVWVGGGGQILHLEGGLVDGAMELRGRRTGPEGRELLDRIRWVPLADGRVRQHWQASTNGGAAWRTVFDGYYSRRGADPGGATR